MTKHRPLERALVLCALILLAAPVSAKGFPDNVLIRYPTVHGRTIVFEAGGNLWSVGLQGGTARRLTADPGYDSNPRFSPNGRWIAFTGWYAGNSDVYVMPAQGGYARRLTDRSYNLGPHAAARDNIVVGWTPNGRNVIFLSRRGSFSPEFWRAYEVPLHGGPARALPLPWTGLLSLSPHGQRVAYNKLLRTQSFHRKDYWGGWAQKIWIYNFRTRRIRTVTTWKGTSTFPMWAGGRIFFASDDDAGGILNLWSYNLRTNAFHQLTHFHTYDVDWPSYGSGRIVFQDGGVLYAYNTRTHRLRAVHVRVPLDGTLTRSYEFAAKKLVTSVGLSPNGQVALFSARGNVFTVPVLHGSPRNLTPTSRASDTDATWSPNGHRIAFITDRTGHSELAVQNVTTRKITVLTHLREEHLTDPKWSPNGRLIAFASSDRSLWVYDLRSHRLERVAQDHYNWMHGYSFAPDSHWLAYSRTGRNQIMALWLYNLETHRRVRISRGLYNDTLPTFDPAGRYLYFVSSRHPNPVLSATGDNFAQVNPDGIYVTTLRADEPSPLAPRWSRPTNPTPKPSTKKPHPKKPAHPLDIQVRGMIARAVALPILPANIVELAARAGALYYETTPIPTVGGPLPGTAPMIWRYSLAHRKATPWLVGATAFTLSANRQVLLYMERGHYFTVGALPRPQKPHRIVLAHMIMHVNPRAEWRTIFWSAWRHVHDYFVNPTFNGRNWKAIGARYARLLPLVASREDLNDLIGNMIGSLDESHMYVFGGDMGYHTPFVATGLLGAKLRPEHGRYRIVRIYRGNNTMRHYDAPLAQPGLRVQNGDYLIAVNHHPLTTRTSPYVHLEDTLGTTVTLTLSTHPSGRDSWDIRVRPIANDRRLLLLHWIRHNRRLVTRLSHGKIGYVYLGDMETLGLDEFIREFYSQLRKPALIIDERWNTGGFIDDMLFDRLTQKLIGMFVDRQRGATTVPGDVYPGYLAAIVNHGSASDGDIFAYEFEKYHLGPVIGSRTWGGVRGYFAPFRLRDGGGLVVSEIALYNRHSHWTVENYGVVPTIRVHDEPGPMSEGHDAQLLTAVRVLLHELAAHPRPLPPPPPWEPAYPPVGRFHAPIGKP